jgi:hypothetical protein
LKTTIVLGSGFSRNVNLPTAKELWGYFNRDVKKSILKFPSGEFKWYDTSDDVERHNGRISHDGIQIGYIFNSVIQFLINRYSLNDYEALYSTLKQNIDKPIYIELVSKAQREYIQEYWQGNSPTIDQLWAFTHFTLDQLGGLMNQLVADLLYPKVQEGEADFFLSSFIQYFNSVFPASIITLNHDLVIEGLMLRNQIPQLFDGFTDAQKVLVHDEDKPALVFIGFAEQAPLLLKLHGSINLYRYQHSVQVNSSVFPTNEFQYFKTNNYYEKHHVFRKNEQGEIIQDFHWKIDPQFITGTNKKDLIQNDYMYRALLQKSDEEIQKSQRLVIIGYSYSDDHLNELIEKALQVGLIKEVINVNPGKEFPYSSEQILIKNLKGISELISLIH